MGDHYLHDRQFDIYRLPRGLDVHDDAMGEEEAEGLSGRVRPTLSQSEGDVPVLILVVATLFLLRICSWSLKSTIHPLLLIAIVEFS